MATSLSPRSALAVSTRMLPAGTMFAGNGPVAFVETAGTALVSAWNALRHRPTSVLSDVSLAGEQRKRNLLRHPEVMELD